MTDYPDPIICRLHESDLKDVKNTVKEIDTKLDDWFGPEGPIWSLGDRMTRVEGSTDRAHERIDAIEVTSKEESKQLNALAIKVGSIAAILTTVAATIVGHFLP